MRQRVVKAGAATIAVVTVFVIAWVLWPRPGTAAPPRARQYLDASACLLTESSGVTPGTPGAQAWHAMESASLASHVMVSYLPDSGAANVPVMLNTLVERRCGLIVVTGASRVQVTSAAKAHPAQSFILVTASAAAGPAAVPSNAVVVPVSDASGRIDQEVTALAGTA